MRTEGRTGSEGGFTLIEVLAAMVILAIGLLGLEALGIGAARSIASAAQQSRFASTATRLMEQKQLEIRRSPATVAATSSCGTDTESGYHVCTTVATRATDASLPRRQARIKVDVSKSSDSPAFTVTSHVFHPSLP